jgi:FtsZ-binding cell division protein ZapB
MRLFSIQIKYDGNHKFFIINNSIQVATKIIKEGKYEVLTNLPLNGYDGYNRVDIDEGYIKHKYPYLVVGDDIYQAKVHIEVKSIKKILDYETNNLMINQLKNAIYTDGEVYYTYQESSKFYWDTSVDYDYPNINNKGSICENVLDDSNYFGTDINDQLTFNTNLYNDYLSSNCDMDLNNVSQTTNSILLQEDYNNLLYIVDALKETKVMLNEENESLIYNIKELNQKNENIEFMYQEMKIKNEELEVENNKLKEELSTFNYDIDNLINEF